MKRICQITMITVMFICLAACGGGEEKRGNNPDPIESAPAATPEGVYAVIEEFINDVSAHSLPDGEWEYPVVGMNIFLGGEVWAKERSTAYLTLAGYQIRVAPNTIVTILEEEEDSITLDLSEGQMWINVEGLEEGEEFEVRLPGAVASVRGTRFSVFALGDGLAFISVLEGRVTVHSTDTGGEVVVEAGYQTFVSPGHDPSTPIPISDVETIKWSIAKGAHLNILLPVLNSHRRIEIQGMTGQPRWSYDGQYFAFYHKDPSETDPIMKYLYFSAESGEYAGARIPDEAWGLAFNPTGSGWAYTQKAADGSEEICYMRDESNPPVCFSNGGCTLGWPWWSPDGEWISFYASATDPNCNSPTSPTNLNIYKIHPDGSDLQQLTSDEIYYSIRHMWSPDNSQIAYVVAPEYNAPGDVWVMNADGSNPQKIFEGILGDGLYHLTWSTDGAWLAAPSKDGGVWIFHPDGSGSHKLEGTDWITSEDKYYDIRWSPSPSGWPLMYRFYTSGEEAGLYYVAQDGEMAQKFLFDGTGPYWSPDGMRVAFSYRELIDVENYIYKTTYLIFDLEPAFWEDGF